MKDIWVVKESELESITARAIELANDLKGTSFFERASTIQKNISNEKENVLLRQREAADALPEPHIAAYRQNEIAFAKMKADLAELENMLVRAKPAGGVAVKRIFVKASWWIILGIIGFLLLLSFVFFFVWQKQASTVETEEPIEEKAPSSINPEEGSEKQ